MRALSIWGLLAILGGAAAYFAMTPAKPKEGRDCAVTLGSKPWISAAEKTPDATALMTKARAIATEELARKTHLDIPGLGDREFDETALGYEIDDERLKGTVDELGRSVSALFSGGKPVDLPIPIKLDSKKMEAAVLAIKEEFDEPVVEATYDFLKKSPLPEKSGRQMDLHATIERLEEAVRSHTERVQAVVEDLKPRRTIADVQSVDASDVLGYFQTQYAQDQAHVDRTFNLRRAASRLDGTVLFPGDSFDFNQVVGPRTEGNGYRVATVIAKGELVDGMGGGTCQIAGTLHAAAFFSGLEIVERHPHTRPSFYIKMGLDAAVAYPTITLRMRNPFPFPVVIRESVEAGFVRAEILGPKRTREVTFMRKIAYVRSFREKEIHDPDVPKGERILVQRGIPGFHVVRFRVVQDGSNTTRERFEDSYPPVKQIWKIGAGEPEKEFEAKNDKHPEYTADEFLEVRQGPGIRSPDAIGVEPGGGTVESHVSGKYGSFGWTVREGFAKALDEKKEE